MTLLEHTVNLAAGPLNSKNNRTTIPITSTCYELYLIRANKHDLHRTIRNGTPNGNKVTISPQKRERKSQGLI